MPDNWSFVFAAYALAALVLGAYWRRLARRERELRSEGATSRPRPQGARASETSPRTDAAGQPADRPDRRGRDAPSDTSPSSDCAGQAGARPGGTARP